MHDQTWVYYRNNPVPVGPSACLFLWVKNGGLVIMRPYDGDLKTGTKSGKLPTKSNLKETRINKAQCFCETSDPSNNLNIFHVTHTPKQKSGKHMVVQVPTRCCDLRVLNMKSVICLWTSWSNGCLLKISDLETWSTVARKSLSLFAASQLCWIGKVQLHSNAMHRKCAQATTPKTCHPRLRASRCWRAFMRNSFAWMLAGLSLSLLMLQCLGLWIQGLKSQIFNMPKSDTPTWYTHGWHCLGLRITL